MHRLTKFKFKKSPDTALAQGFLSYPYKSMFSVVQYLFKIHRFFRSIWIYVKQLHLCSRFTQWNGYYVATKYWYYSWLELVPNEYCHSLLLMASDVMQSIYASAKGKITLNYIQRFSLCHAVNTHCQLENLTAFLTDSVVNAVWWNNHHRWFQELRTHINALIRQR